jgi:hypothetical protein
MKLYPHFGVNASLFFLGKKNLAQRHGVHGVSQRSTQEGIGVLSQGRCLCYIVPKRSKTNKNKITMFIGVTKFNISKFIFLMFLIYKVQYANHIIVPTVNNKFNSKLRSIEAKNSLNPLDTVGINTYRKDKEEKSLSAKTIYIK